MIILDVAKALKDRGYAEIPTTDLVGVLKDSFKTIADMAIAEGDGFALQIPRFGTFKVMKRKARVGFNPQSKEKINIPEKLVFRLKASSKLREEMSVNIGKPSKPAPKKAKKEKKAKKK